MNSSPRNVAILIFDGVEVLDFCGPFEVFSVTGAENSKRSVPFNTYTVAESSIVLARNELSINTHYTFDNCPAPDILLVPGGGGFRADGTPFGTRKEINNEVLLKFIKKCALKTEKLLSVCTGATLLGKAGLLKDLDITTHHSSLEQLANLVPSARVHSNARLCDNGATIVSAGISAGIDMSLYVVSKLLSPEEAQETAAFMEYDWDFKKIKLNTSFLPHVIVEK